MFVIAYLLGLLVCTASIVFAAPYPPVVPTRNVVFNALKNPTPVQTKVINKLVEKLLQDPEFHTKPINEATANLFKNANLGYPPTAPVAARNWEDAMNPIDRELDFVGVEEFHAANQWYEYVPYAEIARRVKIALPEIDLFVRDGDVCKLVPRVGRYLDPNRWADSDDDELSSEDDESSSEGEDDVESLSDDDDESGDDDYSSSDDYDEEHDYDEKSSDANLALWLCTNLG